MKINSYFNECKLEGVSQLATQAYLNDSGNVVAFKKVTKTSENIGLKEQSKKTGSGVGMTAQSAQDTDQKLVARVQQGDKKAFDLLVLKYQHKVAAIISRFVKDHDEVNDVAQETFIKAYRALANFRGDSAFYTWIYRIAVNTAKNYLVSKGRRPPGSDIDVDDADNYPSATGLKDIETPETQLMTQQLEDCSV